MEKEQSEKEAKKEKEEDSMIPEVETEQVEPTFEEIESEIINTPHRGGQPPYKINIVNKNGESETDEQDEVEKEKSKKQLTDIGNWGDGNHIPTE